MVEKREDRYGGRKNQTDDTPPGQCRATISLFKNYPFPEDKGRNSANTDKGIPQKDAANL